MSEVRTPDAPLKIFKRRPIFSTPPETTTPALVSAVRSPFSQQANNAQSASATELAIQERYVGPLRPIVSMFATQFDDKWSADRRSRYRCWRLLHRCPLNSDH
ncbi:hypothetical protein FRC03_008555 [Tulasnella sp. 419]|nr:hypothetical protein FRC03_008555 [Tulasnella sp. 419]